MAIAHPAVHRRMRGTRFKGKLSDYFDRFELELNLYRLVVNLSHIRDRSIDGELDERGRQPYQLPANVFSRLELNRWFMSPVPFGNLVFRDDCRWYLVIVKIVGIIVGREGQSKCCRDVQGIASGFVSISGESPGAIYLSQKSEKDDAIAI